MKGLWHVMGALKALPWRGTCYYASYAAWACFGNESILITCIMTSSVCMMSYNFVGRRIWTLPFTDLIIRLYTIIHIVKRPYRASMAAAKSRYKNSTFTEAEKREIHRKLILQEPRPPRPAAMCLVYHRHDLHGVYLCPQKLRTITP